MFIRQKNQATSRIGICENHQYFCCVNFHNGQPEAHWLEKEKLTDPLIVSVQTQLGLSKPQLIYATPYPFIWRKYLFFPIHYSFKVIYQQIIKYLDHALPIHINDVYFDYQLKKFPEKNTTRAIIYAIKKEYVDGLGKNSNLILDCELFCFVRGIHYLKNEPTSNISEICYQIENNYIHFKPDEFLIHHKKPQNEVIYSLDQVKLAIDIIDPMTYVKALGASLWAGKV